MDSSSSLPFKVGQLAESKSFQRGYRSAWFRCKIHEICRKKGQTRYALEFFDYPEDKIRWTLPYQRPQLGSTKRRKELKVQLMLRPSFPPLFHESEAPSPDAISEVVVIARDFWKVGDMVDWLCEGCYWSGRVIRVLGDDKLQVELPQPPVGEGHSYEVLSRDLRPSLHWSPELGWIVPHPKGRGNSCCARLVRPCKGDEPRAGPSLIDKMDTFSCATESSISSSRSPGSFPLSKEPSDLLGKEKKEGGPLLEDDQVDMNFRSATSYSSNISPGSLLPLTGSSHSGMVSRRQNLEGTGQGIEVEVSSCPLVTPHCDLHAVEKENFREIFGNGDGNRETGAISYPPKVTDSSIEMNQKPLKEDPCSSLVAPKKARMSRGDSLTSAVHPDSVESSVMELEELANKIRWLQRLLKFGAHSSNAVKPSWKFHETGH